MVKCHTRLFTGKIIIDVPLPLTVTHESFKSKNKKNALKC